MNLSVCKLEQAFVRVRRVRRVRRVLILRGCTNSGLFLRCGCGVLPVGTHSSFTLTSAKAAAVRLYHA